MFEIDDKNYFVIVTIDEDDDIYIVKCSKQVNDDDFLSYPLGSLGDNNISCDWAEDKPIGVYRLDLDVTRDDDGDIEEIIVAKNELLYEVTE